MDPNSSSHPQLQAAWKKDALSFADEWLAPIIAWVVVIMIGLAVAGLFFGEE